MFGRLFVTNLRVTLADRTTVFWGMVFPLILATLFHFAFAGLNATDVFKPVPAVIVNSSAYRSNTALSQSIRALTTGDHTVLAVTYVDSREEALARLTELSADAVIESNGAQAVITVRGDAGFNETIVKTAVEQSLQTTSAITAALQKDPRVAAEIGKIGTTNYLHDTTNTGLDRTVIYFYSLIGMTCLYAGFFGIYGANRTEANLSKLGARLSVSPVSKLATLLASFSASYVIACTGQLILYLYLTIGLGVQFGTAAWPTLLVMAIGSIAGLAIGTLIAAGTKLNEITKINLMTVGTMIFSMLAGMMGTTGLKHLIDQNLPLLAAINPVNSISDALYATYYFGIGTRYWFDVLYLALFTFVTVGISWLIVRRKTYASL